MRRSICSSDPSFALAGQKKNWKFSYTTASTLPQGSKLKFDFALQYRPRGWEIPYASEEEGHPLIWLTMPDGEVILSEEMVLPNQPIPAFEFTLPAAVKGGEKVEISLGDPQGDLSKGCQAQEFTQRRRPFHLYIDPKGKGDYGDPEVFTIDVRGNELTNICIFAPSMIAKNRRFDIIVRFEDSYGNLTNNAPEDTLIELSYEFIRENLNWKLFVPETGFIILPNLYFNEPGVYRIQLKSSISDQSFYSAPIQCLADEDFSIYWGHLHGESQKIDASDHIDQYIRHKRDEGGHQFLASSPFESIEETPAEVWKRIVSSVAEYNEDNRFTTILGLQWLGDEGEGLRQLLYWKDGKPMMRKRDSKYTSLKKIYKIHSPKEVLAIPQFTMGKGVETDFSQYNPDFEKVVEIYNAWGSSECPEKEGNPRPIKTTSSNGIRENPKGSIRAALAQNMRFGFVAGGLDDRGVYSSLFDSDQVQYSPGLTAIIAIEQTREALMQALYNRSCYATTGEKIVLGFYIAGSPMGTELNTKNKPGLAYNRHLSGFVCATVPIKELMIIRNGKPLKTFSPNELSYNFTYDDFDQLEKIALTSPDERPSFAYYYIRATQSDGHIAWSSPIWVDLSLSVPPSSPKKGKKKA